jgi:hypothetical protein
MRATLTAGDAACADGVFGIAAFGGVFALGSVLCSGPVVGSGSAATALSALFAGAAGFALRTGAGLAASVRVADEGAAATVVPAPAGARGVAESTGGEVGASATDVTGVGVTGIVGSTGEMRLAVVGSPYARGAGVRIFQTSAATAKTSTSITAAISQITQGRMPLRAPNCGTPLNIA